MSVSPAVAAAASAASAVAAAAEGLCLLAAADTWQTGRHS